MAKKKMTYEEMLYDALDVKEKPYELPDKWVWVRLINGYSECLDKHRKPVNAIEREQRGGTIPYYGATGQVGFIDSFLTNEELVLIGEDGAPFLDFLKNKAYIIDGKAWVNNHAHILRSFTGSVGNKLLLHYLNVFDYSKYVNGATRLKLTQSKMKSIPLPLPPIQEQQRIVDKIDNMFEKLDRAKELLQECLDEFENRRCAILYKAFTGELTRKWREENGISLDSWEKKELGELGDWGGGGTPSKSKTEYWDKGSILWITPKDMKSMYIDDTILKITKTGNENSSAQLVKPNSILFVVRSGILRRILPISINKIETTLNQDMKSLTLNKDIPEFVYYYCSCFEENIRRECAKSGTTVESVDFKKLKLYTIKVPLIDEQKQIVNVLSDFLKKEDKSKDLINTIEDIDMMKKTILAKAFRGELSTGSEDDEDAMRLVERICRERAKID